MKGTKQLGVNLLLALLAIGCAKERPLKPVIEDSLRVKKTALDGTFHYLRTITDSKYTAGSKQYFLPAGLHMSSDSLVQFKVKKDVVEVTAVDPLFNTEATAKHTAVLLSFPVTHVDVLRRQNADGTDTHEEEVTTTRRPWDQRDYVVVDVTKNLAEIADLPDVKTVTAVGGIQIDTDSKHIDFRVEKTLSTESVLTERYSFLKFEPSASYSQRVYSKELQTRIGVFKTRTYRFDKYGRALESLLEEMMNRWDTSKKVVYYLTANFPEHLKPAAHAVFREWNAAFVQATGHDVLELRDNSGQEIGDLRYSMVAYIDGNEAIGLLGYGPLVANPRTGEIIKADVFLYGGSLRRTVFREREWTKGKSSPLRSNATASPATGIAGRLKKFLADGRFERLKQGPVKNETDLVKQVLNTARSDQGILDSKVLVSRAKKLVGRKGMEFTTPLSEDTLALVSTLTAARLSDEEVEVKVFAPLLAHELGHTLGLRHNFMGSADQRHFEGDSKSASVMDYGFLSVEEPMGPGSYDVAAIQVAYGDGKPETIKRQLDKNYLFCTDDNVFDSRAGLCLQHDQGGSLAEVARNQVLNYFKSHQFNNQRNDRVSFPDFNSYLNSVIMTLLPIRLVYDHANAIVTNGASYAEGSTVAKTEDSDRILWGLLKQRAEADPDSKETRSVRTSLTRTVTIDVAKVQSEVKNAVSARAMAFAGLRIIILDNSPDRPDLDGGDWEFNELVVRGVLVDKIYALLFLMMPTGDPASVSGTVTVFDQFHRPMATVLNDLLSNTSIDPIAGLQIGTTSINLRYVALELLQIFASFPTISSGELLELIQLNRITGQPVVTAANEAAAAKLVTELEAVRTELAKAQLEAEFTPTPEAEQKVDALQKQVLDKHVELSRLQLRLSVGDQDPDAAALVKSSELRAQLVELLVQMEITGPNEGAEQRVGELFGQLVDNNIAQIAVSDGRVLKAPLRFSTFGDLETASGRLLFLNLNLIEDRAAVVKGMLPFIDLSILAAKSEAEKAEMQALKNQLLEQSLMLERYISMEKRFVQRLYDAYRL